MNPGVSKFSINEVVLFSTIIVCFLIISFESLTNNFLNILDEKVEGGYSTYFSILLITVFGTIWFRKKAIIFTGIDFVLLLYALYFLFSYNLNVTQSLRDLLDSFVVLLWLFSFKIGNNIGKWSDFKIQQFILYFIAIVIGPILIQTIMLYMKNDILSFKLFGNDSIFALTVYLPFIFLIEKQRLLKIVIIICFAIISILSYKRSIIIATFISLIIYIVFSSRKEYIFKYLFKWYSLPLLIGLIYIYEFVYSVVSQNIFSRFESLSEDGGSGRTDIYDKLWETFLNSNNTEFFLGHGYQSTKDYIGILAHNDFLQLMFDFGLIGVFLYGLFITSILRMAFITYKLRRCFLNLFSAYVAAIVLFLILTLTNCFIYSPSLLSPIMFFLGITYFYLKKRRKSTSHEK